MVWENAGSISPGAGVGMKFVNAMFEAAKCVLVLSEVELTLMSDNS